MGISILIVDDDKLLVEKLEETVNWSGIGIDMVFTANNIRQAQKLLEEYPIEMLLCDIDMPQGNGLELLEWIRYKKLDIECTFLSSYANFAYAQMALKLSSREYLLKPISNADLETALRRIVGIVQEKHQKQKKQEKKGEELADDAALSPLFSVEKLAVLQHVRKEGRAGPEYGEHEEHGRPAGRAAGGVDDLQHHLAELLRKAHGKFGGGVHAEHAERRHHQKKDGDDRKQEEVHPRPRDGRRVRGGKIPIKRLAVTICLFPHTLSVRKNPKNMSAETDCGKTRRNARVNMLPV